MVNVADLTTTAEEIFDRFREYIKIRQPRSVSAMHAMANVAVRTLAVRTHRLIDFICARRETFPSVNGFGIKGAVHHKSPCSSDHFKARNLETLDFGNDK